MKNPELTPQEQAELDRQREAQQTKQPYAAEADDRELEHAHKQDRPVKSNPEPKSDRRR